MITTNLYLEIDSKAQEMLRGAHYQIFLEGQLWHSDAVQVECHFDEHFQCFRSERVQIKIGEKFRFVAYPTNTSDMKIAIVC